jgi:precorrin-2 dehydrogenase / sirohydrochlorin ferrochelatase
VAHPYPVFLDLTGVPVLLVGAGNIAARKLDGLLAAGATVTVVAPLVRDEVRAMVPHRIHERTYVPGDVDGMQLVMTATDDASVNAAVAADAKAAGVFVNSADDPPNCSFILPAVHRQGLITVAVSTGGASPALAQRLRSEIAALVGLQWAAAAEDLQRQRREIQAAGGSTEDIDWRPRVDAALAAATDPSSGATTTG